MAIPFSGFFENLKGRFSGKNGRAARPEAPPFVPVEKPSSERLSKTVVPNATRAITASNPFDVSTAVANGAVVMAVPPPSRVVSLGRTQTSQKPNGLPPAVALALEPRIERTVALKLVDIIPAIPADWLKPSAAFDTDKRILLKAAELEKGMAVGTPKTSLLSIYQQIPDSFMKPVPASETMQIELPMTKVLEEFSSARNRRDQMSEELVPQVDTPFLQVTIEDTKKFGGTAEPITISTMPMSMPNIRMQPATAQTLADAEPEPTASETFTPSQTPPPDTAIKPVYRTAPAPKYADAVPVRAVVAAPPKAVEAAPQPAADNQPLRIPISFPPNGAGELANQRVPASGEPPVPKEDVAAAQPTAPARIPFQLSGAALRVAVDPTPQAEVETAVASDEPQVTLPLRPILETVPSMQLRGDARGVGDDATISFPYSLLQPQLASGRIAISPKRFCAAMPKEHQHLFDADVLDVPVALPLADVLQHLPASSLQLRDDQEELVMREEFMTPFALKAKEDAERFANGATTTPNEPALAEEPAAEDAPVAAAVPAAVDDTVTEVAAPEQAKRRPLNKKSAQCKTADVTEAPKADPLDGKQLVARVCELDGVAACAVTFTDGLQLAGNIPDDFGLDGIIAMAPSMLKRVEKHMENTKLGPVSAVTLQCSEAAVTFVTCGSVCVTAVHKDEPMSADARGKLVTMTQEISQTYSQPENANVDH